MKNNKTNKLRATIFLFFLRMCVFVCFLYFAVAENFEIMVCLDATRLKIPLLFLWVFFVFSLHKSNISYKDVDNHTDIQVTYKT